jgi:hypothetical protein
MRWLCAQKPDDAVCDQTRPAEDTGGGMRIVCRNCLATVCRPGDRAEYGGKHAHVFFNPSGLVFEIGCFARAPGCAATGQPTTEFTWFPGRAWQLALCRSCQAHLGWRYADTGGSGSAFFGLILDRLEERADDAG